MGAGRSRVARLPVGLARWDEGCSIPASTQTPLSPEAFLRARSLRTCPAIACPRQYDGGGPRSPTTRRRASPRSSHSGSRSPSDGDGTPVVVPAGEGVDRALAMLASDRGCLRAGRHVVAVQGVPQGDVRLDLLRPVPQPLLELVLDDDLREPVEDGGLSPPAGHGVRSALYVVALAFGRVRRRSSGALLAAPSASRSGRPS